MPVGFQVVKFKRVDFQGKWAPKLLGGDQSVIQYQAMDSTCKLDVVVEYENFPGTLQKYVYSPLVKDIVTIIGEVAHIPGLYTSSEKTSI
jgi:hypothetical protein